MPTFDDNLDAARNAVLAAAGGIDRRMMVAVAGPPGAGKSTLAEALVGSLGQGAVLVPMDGFHLDDRLLGPAGLLPVKGAPQTFDADGFVQAMFRLRAGDRDVILPVFDRSREIAIAGAIRVPAAARIVVVEGNYLLLDRAPWAGLAGCFDFTIMVAPTLDDVASRLARRWAELGPEGARAKIEGNDLPNARLVLEASRPADLTLA